MNFINLLGCLACVFFLTACWGEKKAKETVEDVKEEIVETTESIKDSNV